MLWVLADASIRNLNKFEMYALRSSAYISQNNFIVTMECA